MEEKEKRAKSSGKSGHGIDMLNGPLLPRILLFALPLALSSILQLLFNAADVVVLGRFVGPDALAAVGSTASLINLLVNLFVGLSVGVNVLVARNYARGDEAEVQDIVHTSVAVSVLSGILLIFVGYYFSGPMLLLMGSPENVLPMSVIYLRIYFAGMPFILLYDFGAAILRAIGDTRRPLYYLLFAGVLNVFLNLFFVLVCNMGVAGVAIATSVSNMASSLLVARALMREESALRLHLRRLKVDLQVLKKIFTIGLPAGIQGCIFSVSNVLIQSSVNSFGYIVMAGSTASNNLEGFVYQAMNAVYQANLSFTSQNVGAGKLQRVVPILLRCLGVVLTVGVGLSGLALLFNHQLLGIYSSDQEVIRYGLGRLEVVCATYFLCGMMDVVCGSVRGLGSSVVPTIVSLTGACGLRILWIYTIFAENRTLFFLYLSYPITWVITFSAHLVCFFIFLHRRKKRAAQALQELPQDASA